MFLVLFVFLHFFVVVLDLMADLFMLSLVVASPSVWLPGTGAPYFRMEKTFEFKQATKVRLIQPS